MGFSLCVWRYIPNLISVINLHACHLSLKYSIGKKRIEGPNTSFKNGWTDKSFWV